MRKLAARFDVIISTILKQIGKVKKLDRWVSNELNDRQKRNHREAYLFCCHGIKANHFYIVLLRVMKNEFFFNL